MRPRWLQSLVVLSTVAASGAAVGPQSANASSSPTSAPMQASAQVAYPAYTRDNASSRMGSTGVLRVVGLDGTGDHALPTPTPVAGDVSWNPSGTKIAYTAAIPGGDVQVWTINADGTDAHAVTPDGYRLPVWSPDGTKLVVATIATQTEPYSSVAVADLATGMTRTITDTSGTGTLFGPALWAPDGSKLAFLTAVYMEGSGGTATINIVNPDGSDRILLPAIMDGALNAERELAWSPDGEWLAFDGYQIAGDQSKGVLQIVHPDGSGLRTIDAGTPTTYGDGDIGGFSPDGTRVMLTSITESPAHTDAVSLTGAVTTMHVARAGDPDPAFDVATSWSPSGSQIEFCEQNWDFAGQTLISNLFATGPGDSGLRQLTTSGQACYGSVPSASPRFAGADRVGTAISSSRANFTHASSVVIARADMYPDALAAAPLAGKVGGPILLSPTGGLTAALTAEVTRLGATTAYLIGDTTALSETVAAGLAAAGVTTSIRIGGATRYDTAALIAERVGGTSVYLARGDDWADAAAISALAAFEHRPVLLTPATSLSSAAADALAELHATSATIVGGSAAVSTSAEATLRGDGVTTTRLAGADRWATSAAVASRAVSEGMSGPPWLASGANWPDAVSAGPAAAASKGVLLLVAPVDLAGSPASETWLAAHPSTNVVAVGGPDVVSAQDVAEAHLG